MKNINAVQTTQKRGRNGNPVPVGKKFTKDTQPPPENKSAGKQKKKFSRDVIREMLSMPYKFAPDSQIKQQLIKAFGPGIESMSVAEVMTLQQMQKATLKGDTQAFHALLDQGLGRPLQAIAQVDNEGNNVKPVTLSLPVGMNISLPANIEGEGEEP